MVDGAQLARSMAAASRMVNSTKSRTVRDSAGRRGGVTTPMDPEEDESDMESEDLELWKLLPQLKDLPESLVKKLPMTALFQLNSALAKERKTSEKLGVNTRLANNAKKLARCPVDVEGGRDNRKNLLHPARFLGGASCSLGEIWGEARRVIGETGVVPIGNYDLDTVGCGGCVTPKAWLERHNPASQELKLRLFHLPNVAGTSTGKKQEAGEDFGESYKEKADLDSFKVALNTAREAMASALPWNRSISALVGLMMNTNYMVEELGATSSGPASSWSLWTTCSGAMR